MNKKLISLAVAAALAAPAVAMAEATLYGKLGVSVDYQDVTNSTAPIFSTVPTGAARLQDFDVVSNDNGTLTITGA